MYELTQELIKAIVIALVLLAAICWIQGADHLKTQKKDIVVCSRVYPVGYIGMPPGKYNHWRLQ